LTPPGGQPRLKRFFVYGSLMRGGPFEALLPGRRDVRFLGPARCRGTLYDLGQYPGLVLSGRTWVAGELYQTDAVEETIRRLDPFEGEAGFERREASVRWKHGPGPAWVYVYAGPLHQTRRIPGGSWAAWVRSERVSPPAPRRGRSSR
jgi:gamma-glutamylcyclotransferase (GGCT)/AIG2-like uncharacterized protein YtfP